MAIIHVQNRDQLVGNGKTILLKKARAYALKSLEHALIAVDPKQLLCSKIKVENSCFVVDNVSLDLEHYKHVYVLGGGKAGGSMAQVIEKLLGRRVTAGVVNVPYGSKVETEIVELNEASHPVPNQAGVEGTFRMIDMAEQAQADDLVICLISGGGSSLMPLPREGISLRDKQELTDSLLKSGAAITEINVVRKHLSLFKGGKLAEKVFPATLLNLILSDVLGDPLDSIASGPTVPDPSTFSDSIKVLERYRLWENVPESIRVILTKGAEGLVEETPKPGNAAFSKVHNVVIGNNRTASQAAAECLKLDGLKTIHFDDPLDGEARHIGKALAKFASKASTPDFSLPKPIAVVAGGETTVTVTGSGLGGRNQELELAAAINLKGAETCVIASLSTDGVDGPTDAAGAIVDGHTLIRAENFGLNPQKYLEENDSYHFFLKLNDLIITKPTGTNVNDISVIIIL